MRSPPMVAPRVKVKVSPSSGSRASKTSSKWIGISSPPAKLASDMSAQKKMHVSTKSVSANVRKPN